MPDVISEAVKPGLRSGLTERAEKLDAALTVFRAEIAADQFANATGKFREAVNLSRSWPELRTRVMRVGVEQAKGLLPRNWRVAEALLAETRGLESEYQTPSELWDKVRAAQHEEIIDNAISLVDVTESIDSVDKAKVQLESFLSTHPNDPRLIARLGVLNGGPKPQSAPAPIEAEAPSDVEEAEELGEDDEDAEEDSDGVVSLGGQRLKIAVSSTAWEKFKTAVSLVATAAMLGTAGTLVWMHYQHPPSRRVPAAAVKPTHQTPIPKAVPAVPVAPSAPVDLAGAEEKAWQIVASSRKAEDVQLFLSLFPASPHVGEARDMMQAAEEKDWQNLNHSSALALEMFLRNHASGGHVKAAQEELSALQAKAPR